MINLRTPSTLILLSIFLITSCQKETTPPVSNIISGSIQQDSTGNCQAVLQGTFKKDSILNNSHFIEVQLNTNTAGTYDISSDTINGYYFSGNGTLVAGTNAARLFGRGQPVGAGTNTFTIRYDSSSCRVAVPVTAVIPPTPQAYFSMGSGGICTNVTPAGTYQINTPLNNSNTVAIGVQVITPGTYSLTTTIVNGVSFSASGVFTSIGSQTLILIGSGTPTTSGNFNYSFPGVALTCSFNVNYTTIPNGNAVYTFGGGGSSCTGVVLTGLYVPAITMSDTNTATINVIVTVPGPYTLSTNTVAGVTFSASGNFTTTGAQTVTLKASGYANTSPSIKTYTLTAPGGISCTFSVNYQAYAFIMLVNGMNAPCSNSSVQGLYKVGVPLNASNTITVQVSVGPLESGYCIVRGLTQNGMNFTKAFLFTTTGMHTVVLPGSGTPITAGVMSFEIGAGLTNCFTPITVNP